MDTMPGGGRTGRRSARRWIAILVMVLLAWSVARIQRTFASSPSPVAVAAVDIQVYGLGGRLAVVREQDLRAYVALDPTADLSASHVDLWINLPAVRGFRWMMTW
jgi:hypothetical protein